MQSIKIDFEVFKELTSRRESAKMTYNEVIRNLLDLGETNMPESKEETGASFVSKSVIFPHGTKFRARYKGKIYAAEVDNGVIMYNNREHTSFSSAARAVTGTNVNGWIFWEFKRPNEGNWTSADKEKEEANKSYVFQ